MTELYRQLHEASDHVSELTGRHHRVAITLGSGLGGYADGLPNAVAIPYADIPHFPVPTVTGHGGKLVSAVFGDTGVLILAGGCTTTRVVPSATSCSAHGSRSSTDAQPSS